MYSSRIQKLFEPDPNGPFCLVGGDVAELRIKPFEAAALFTKAVGDIARARGKMQLARDTGVTREGLYKALGEQGNPSFATVVKVMHALGLQFNVGARTE